MNLTNSWFSFQMPINWEGKSVMREPMQRESWNPRSFQMRLRRRSKRRSRPSMHGDTSCWSTWEPTSTKGAARQVATAIKGASAKMKNPLFVSLKPTFKRRASGDSNPSPTKFPRKSTWTSPQWTRNPMMPFRFVNRIRRDSNRSKVKAITGQKLPKDYLKSRTPRWNYHRSEPIPIIPITNQLSKQTIKRIQRAAMKSFKWFLSLMALKHHLTTSWYKFLT